MELFVLKGSLTEDNWNIFEKEVGARACISQKIADKYHLEYVPLQDKFQMSASSISSELLVARWCTSYFSRA